MSHRHTGASPLGRAPRIRMLLARADDAPDQSARFWALAVASQLIEEHLATIERCLHASHHPAQQARYRHVRLAWTGCLVIICARLDDARRQTTRSRQLRAKRKYNQTACAMIAGGNRWRL